MASVVCRGVPAGALDYSSAKAARLAERAADERRQQACLDELAALASRSGTADLERVRISDDARRVLLDLYARALAVAASSRPGSASAAGLRVIVRSTPGRGTTLVSPEGVLSVVDATLALEVFGVDRRNTG